MHIETMSTRTSDVEVIALGVEGMARPIGVVDESVVVGVLFMRAITSCSFSSACERTDMNIRYRNNLSIWHGLKVYPNTITKKQVLRVHSYTGIQQPQHNSGANAQLRVLQKVDRKNTRKATAYTKLAGAHLLLHRPDARKFFL